MQKKVKYGLSLLLLFLSAIIFVAVMEYYPGDPSFNHAIDTTPQNMLGHAGAYIADLLLQCFGWGAYIVPLFLVVWCIRVLLSEAFFSFIRVAFLVVALLPVTLAFATYPTLESWPFYVGYGGILGDVAYDVFFSADKASFSLLIQAVLWSFATILTLIALGVTRQEIQYVISLSRQVVAYLWFAVRYSAIFCYNLYCKLKKKEPIETAVVLSKPKAPEKPKPLASVVEKRRTVKKRKAEQQSLGLASDEYVPPPLDVLMKEKQRKRATSQSSLEQNAKLLKSVLADFGVYGEIIKVRPGPVVTLYELEPSPGTKSSRVIGLSDDIARSMSAVSARISVIPGKNLLGIELPNSEREIVYFRELLETEEYKDLRIKLPMVLGKDIGGGAVMADLSRMPHLLVAGTTGSGKSVAINAMVLSFLYRMSPDECKFIMIDPKMLELSVYDGIPHLLSPVVTEPGKAVVALKWAVREMEDRYRLMSNLGVRNMSGYNKRIEDALKKGEQLERTVQTGYDPDTGKPVFEKQALEMKKMPFIVIIVDEMADLMLTAGKDIEASVQRLAQMARAAGIHLIMATQRPSVDVITGVIKANFPTRISFQVTSKVDSRTILGEMGAEQLLGMGDMLYMSGGSRITRVHGPFVDDREVTEVVDYLKQTGEPEYIEEVTEEDEAITPDMMGSMGDSGNDLYDKAVAIVIRDKKASTSYVQRQLKIGYNRAADLIDRMEQEGVISPANHAGKREILVGNS